MTERPQWPLENTVLASPPEVNPQKGLNTRMVSASDGRTEPSLRPGGITALRLRMTLLLLQ